MLQVYEFLIFLNWIVTERFLFSVFKPDGLCYVLYAGKFCLLLCRVAVLARSETLKNPPRDWRMHYWTTTLLFLCICLWLSREMGSTFRKVERNIWNLWESSMIRQVKVAFVFMWIFKNPNTGKYGMLYNLKNAFLHIIWMWSRSNVK